MSTTRAFIRVAAVTHVSLQPGRYCWGFMGAINRDVCGRLPFCGSDLIGLTTSDMEYYAVNLDQFPYGASAIYREYTGR